MLQAMASVSATWEAEPGRLLQLMNLRPNWVAEHHSFPKNKQTEASETVQQLLALAIPADLSSVLSTQIRWLIMAYDSSFKTSDTFS